MRKRIYAFQAALTAILVALVQHVAAASPSPCSATDQVAFSCPIAKAPRFEAVRRIDLIFDVERDIKGLDPRLRHAAEPARTDVAEARRQWRALQGRLRPERLVLLDETWTKTNMTRSRGRARRGHRLVDAVPHGHWKTTAFLAGFRHDRLVAPVVIDGAIDGALFRARVEQSLAPTLWVDDVVVADNLGTHKAAGVREAIEDRGAIRLFSLPYSPDFNPLRTGLRQAQAADPQRRAQNTRDTLAHHRIPPRSLHPTNAGTTCNTQATDSQT